ncbi:MAG TPA: peptidylprolyl isomerase [Longilinea sp.]|nr:peptidylprolyl isomerase [Longilinea sp.]
MPPSPTPLSKKHLARLEKENLQKKIIIIATIAVVVIVLGIIGYGILDQNVLKYQKPVAKAYGTNISVHDFTAYAQISRLMQIQSYNYYNYYLQYAEMVGDYMTAYQAYSAMQTVQSNLADANTFGSSVLNEMIENVVLEQQAAKMSPPVTVSDQEVNETMMSWFGYYPNGTPTSTITPTEYVYSTPTYDATQLALLNPTAGPTNTPTEGPSPTTTPTEAPTFTETAAPTDTPTPENTPTSEFTPTVGGTPTTTLTPSITPTPTVYTTEIYQQNLSDYLTQISEYNLTETDVRNYVKAYLLRQKMLTAVAGDEPSSGEQVWARHILVASEADAQKVEDELKAGQPWNEVAASMSTDTSTAQYGGDLGWFPRGYMVKEFEDAAFSLKIGQISDPVQTKYGWHIIQLLGHVDNMPISASMQSTIQQSKFSDWLSNLTSSDQVTKTNDWINYVPVSPTLPASSAG